MANSNEGSVAPKERVNIVYKPATDGAQSEVELPLKMLIVGDFTQAEDQQMLEDRTPISVNKDNFNEVFKAQKLELNFTIPNNLPGANTNEQRAIKLEINSLQDFEPDHFSGKDPVLSKLNEFRKALKSLKSPLSNKPDFRKKIQEIIQDDSLREALLTELGINEERNRE